MITKEMYRWTDGWRKIWSRDENIPIEQTIVENSNIQESYKKFHKHDTRYYGYLLH